MSKIDTVGPKTITKANRPIAKIKLTLERILTPLPSPDKADMINKPVVTIIMTICTRALLGIPKTI